MKTKISKNQMNKENSSELNKDETPWYGRLILFIVFILFVITTFYYYYFIIEQLFSLVPSWMDSVLRQYINCCMTIEEFHSRTLLHFFNLYLM